MTKRELLLNQIRSEKLWLRMLTDNRISKQQLGLPMHITRRQAIDDALDRINEYRNQLNQIQDGE